MFQWIKNFFEKKPAAAISTAPVTPIVLPNMNSDKDCIKILNSLLPNNLKPNDFKSVGTGLSYFCLDDNTVSISYTDSASQIEYSIKWKPEEEAWNVQKKDPGNKKNNFSTVEDVEEKKKILLKIQNAFQKLSNTAAPEELKSPLPQLDTEDQTLLDNILKAGSLGSKDKAMEHCLHLGIQAEILPAGKGLWSIHVPTDKAVELLKKEREKMLQEAIKPAQPNTTVIYRAKTPPNQPLQIGVRFANEDERLACQQELNKLDMPYHYQGNRLFLDAEEINGLLCIKKPSNNKNPIILQQLAELLGMKKSFASVQEMRDGQSRLTFPTLAQSKTAPCIRDHVHGMPVNPGNATEARRLRNKVVKLAQELEAMSKQSPRSIGGTENTWQTHNEQVESKQKELNEVRAELSSVLASKTPVLAAVSPVAAAASVATAPKTMPRKPLSPSESAEPLPSLTSDEKAQLASIVQGTLSEKGEILIDYTNINPLNFNLYIQKTIGVKVTAYANLDLFKKANEYGEYDNSVALIRMYSGEWKLKIPDHYAHQLINANKLKETPQSPASVTPAVTPALPTLNAEQKASLEKIMGSSMRGDAFSVSPEKVSMFSKYMQEAGITLDSFTPPETPSIEGSKKWKELQSKGNVILAQNGNLRTFHIPPLHALKLIDFMYKKAELNQISDELAALLESPKNPNALKPEAVRAAIQPASNAVLPFKKQELDPLEEKQPASPDNAEHERLKEALRDALKKENGLKKELEAENDLKKLVEALEKNQEPAKAKDEASEDEKELDEMNENKEVTPSIDDLLKAAQEETQKALQAFENSKKKQNALPPTAPPIEEINRNIQAKAPLVQPVVKSPAVAAAAQPTAAPAANPTPPVADKTPTQKVKIFEQAMIDATEKKIKAANNLLKNKNLENNTLYEKASQKLQEIKNSYIAQIRLAMKAAKLECNLETYRDLSIKFNELVGVENPEKQNAKPMPSNVRKGPPQHPHTPEFKQLAKDLGPLSRQLYIKVHIGYDPSKKKIMRELKGVMDDFTARVKKGDEQDESTKMLVEFREKIQKQSDALKSYPEADAIAQEMIEAADKAITAKPAAELAAEQQASPEAPNNNQRRPGGR